MQQAQPAARRQPVHARRAGGRPGPAAAGSASQAAPPSACRSIASGMSSAVKRQSRLAYHLRPAAAAATGDGEPELWSSGDLPEPVTTTHNIVLKNAAGGTTLEYEATAGLLPIVLDEVDGAKGSLFFVAYTTAPEPGGAVRPTTFCFNGGPGSASVWLHLGGLGPKRVELLPDGGMPPPPYRLIDNEETWLPTTDLVFVDAMGTGYSRPNTVADGARFFGSAEDLSTFTGMRPMSCCVERAVPLEGPVAAADLCPRPYFAEFIRIYLSKYQKWLSPLYLAGESYGTFRAAGLASHALSSAGISFQGILLISSVLSLQTLWDPISANHLPLLGFLPTYTATAWYHRVLEPALQVNRAPSLGQHTPCIIPSDRGPVAVVQSQPLRKVLDEVEKWVLNTYASALAKGERLPPHEREQVATQMARYTGLTKQFVLQSNLQIDDGAYRKELLRAASTHSPTSRRTVGRLDSRYIGVDRFATGAQAEFDPAMKATSPVFAACFNDYVTSTLKFETQRRYYILGGFPGFKWRYPENAFGDTSEMLRQGMTSSPYTKVLVLNGIYDMATPYFATEWTFAHLDLEPELRANIKMAYYEGGHMMYADTRCLAQMRVDIEEFFADLQQPQPRAVFNVPGRTPE
jgi:carboxypeptidase C (cathepsin A)